MNLVIVSGAEATCKTAIGKHVAASLGFQYQSKDHIKEQLFDNEPKTTWNYGWYEHKAKHLFFEEIAAFIKDGTDVVVESNFIGQDRIYLEKLLQNKAIKLSEIYCYAKGFTSFKRFVHRNETKVRHPGHHDRRWYFSVFFQCSLRIIGVEGIHKPIGLTNRLLKVETTDYANIDFQKIVTFIQSQ